MEPHTRSWQGFDGLGAPRCHCGLLHCLFLVLVRFSYSLSASVHLLTCQDARDRWNEMLFGTFFLYAYCHVIHLVSCSASTP